jgi:hypothetical protein
MNSFFLPALRIAYLCLWLGLLTLLIGCGKNPYSVDHAEVSGKVLFGGKPLPGGKVTFITVNGGFASIGTIDENGNDQIKAPVGEVEIGVTNQMLKSNAGAKGKHILAKAEAKERQPLKGRWVKIPPQYEDPHASGLKYTVKRGEQTHDIELSANPGPASGVPGS